MHAVGVGGLAGVLLHALQGGVQKTAVLEELLAAALRPPGALEAAAVSQQEVLSPVILTRLAGTPAEEPEETLAEPGGEIERGMF